MGLRAHCTGWSAVRLSRRRPRLSKGFWEDETVSEEKQFEMADLTDADVVRLAQSGDAAAFERIYRLHSRKVYSLCLRMAGNRTEAEDLTQDVFLQLFRKIGMFRGDSAFSTWLHRVAVNIVLQRFRKKAPVETSLETVIKPDEEFDTPPMEFGSPDPRLNGVIDRITLQAAIDELAPGYKAMFVLHDVEGYDHSEIARMFGCSVGNSKSQVHKARLQLRKVLRKALCHSRRERAQSAAGSHATNQPKYTLDYAHA
jgi:RNA polymerase sigma-70 factor, ECF subfamily